MGGVEGSGLRGVGGGGSGGGSSGGRVGAEKEHSLAPHASSRPSS